MAAPQDGRTSPYANENGRTSPYADQKNINNNKKMSVRMDEEAFVKSQEVFESAEIELSAERIAFLRQRFDEFDTDHGGSIDENELHAAIKSLGVKCSQNASRKLLAKIDDNNDGTVDFEEFIAFFHKAQDPHAIKKLLSEACSKYLDYKQAAAGDPNFSKHYPLPNSVESKTNCFARVHQKDIQAMVSCGVGKIATGGLDKLVLIWPTDGGRKVKHMGQLDHKYPVYCLSSHEDRVTGRNIIAVGTGANDGGNNQGQTGLKLWDANTCTEFQGYSGHTAPIFSNALFDRGKRLASGERSGRILVHDVERKGDPLIIGGDQYHQKTVQSINILNDNLLLTSCNDGDVKVIDLRATDRPALVIEDAAATEIVYDSVWRDSTSVISCGADFAIKRWDLANVTAGPVTDYMGHVAPVRKLALAPDGRTMLSGAEDGSIRGWIIEEIEEINQHHESLSSHYDARKGSFANHEFSENADKAKTTLLQAGLDWEHIKAIKDERTSADCVQSFADYDGHRGARVSGLLFIDAGESFFSCGVDEKMLKFQYDAPAPGVFRRWAPKDKRSSTMQF